MKSFGPKSLIPIGKSNLLEIQLMILQEIYPKNDIVIVSGFEDYKIREFVDCWSMNKKIIGSKDVRVIKNENYRHNNVAQSVALGTEYCDSDNYLIVYGDLLFNKATFSELRLNRTGVLIDNKNQFSSEEVGVVLDENNKVSNFCYDSDIKWSQIAYLQNKDMEIFLDIMDNPSREKWFCFEVFNLMLEKTSITPYYNSKSVIIELDASKDVHEARKMHEEGKV